MKAFDYLIIPLIIVTSVSTFFAIEASNKVAELEKTIETARKIESGVFTDSYFKTLTLPNSFDSDPLFPEEGQVWTNTKEKRVKSFINGKIESQGFVMGGVYDPESPKINYTNRCFDGATVHGIDVLQFDKSSINVALFGHSVLDLPSGYSYQIVARDTAEEGTKLLTIGYEKDKNNP